MPTERQESNGHRAERATKAKNYVRSRLIHDERRLMDKFKAQNSVHCPKVPSILRKTEGSYPSYYDPKIVSFGPYHHEKSELQATQVIKTKVMENFILEYGKSIEDLYIKVHELNDCARSYYVEGSTLGYNDDDFAMMMLQDGCFILFFIEWRTFSLKKRNEEMISCLRDRVLKRFFDLGISELKQIYRDLILLENQIPFTVLNVLMSNIYHPENYGLTMIKSFLNWVLWGKFEMEETRDDHKEEPVHLLGILKTLISKCGDHVKTVPKDVDVDVDMDMTRYLQSSGSVCDLQAKGINFKPNNSISLHSTKKEKPKSISLRDVEFRSGYFTGELILPPLVLFSDSVVYYTNLIALEMCDPIDFTVTSYFSFMNSLISDTRDVKALRSKRIILHSMSTDRDVFIMLKEMSSLEWLQDFSIHQGVTEKIEKHYNSKKRMWIAQIRDKYFSQPWSVFGLLATVVVLILSFLQTFYTINIRKA